MNRPFPLRLLGSITRPRAGGFARAGAVAAAILVLVFAGACSAVGTRSGGTTNSVAPMPPSSKESGVPYATDGTATSPGAATPPSSGVAKDGGSGGVALPGVDASRSVIRTGSMDLEVRSVSAAVDSVRQIATAAQGSVTDSTFAGDKDRQTASVTLRVPTDRLGDVMAQLQKIATETRSVTTNSRDVTEEVTDVEATLRNLRAVESQYQTMLARTGSIAEVLQVQDRLNQTRLQIDRTEARRKSLQSQSDMATLTVSLRPVTGAPASGSGPLQSVRAAWTVSLLVLETAGTAVLMAVVFLWWFWPLAAVAVWFAVRQVRHAQRAIPPAAGGSEV